MTTTPIQNRRIAIIGGAGFIGHNVALHLRQRGAHVELIDNLQVNNLLSLMGNRDGVPHPDLSLRVVHERLRLLREADVSVHGQDARDYHSLSRTLSEIKPQVILHLAAVSHANRSNKDPYSTFDHSLRTLENALDWARGRAEHFIFLSSSMVYGHFNGKAVDETTACEPLGIYGALKFSGEKMIIAYNQVFGLPYTIVRPSALYGERCISRRVGQIFIENALSGSQINVKGNGSDGLDFTYIEDLVSGITKIIESDKARNEIFNMTYGSARSIADMIDILRKDFPKVEVRFLPKDDLTPDRGTLSVDKARALLGYKPHWQLDKGYPRYINWYRDLFERFPELRN